MTSNPSDKRAYLGHVGFLVDPWGAVPGVGLFTHVTVSLLLRSLAAWGRLGVQQGRAWGQFLAGEVLTGHAGGWAVNPAIPVGDLRATVQLPALASV